MADVKWIKIVTGIFDDEKILLIESLPEADSIIVIWFKLLCLAGKQNNSGVFVMSNGLPYTEQMLATIFRRKEAAVKMALSTFEQFGMVEIINDAYTIPNWGKHQTMDRLEQKNEYMRQYMQEYRRKQAALSSGQTDNTECKSNRKSNCKVNSKVNVSSLDKNREEDIEEEIEKEGEVIEEPDAQHPVSPASIPYESIKNLYNSLCTHFPCCKVMSDARKKAIRARYNSGYDFEDFRELFTKAEASSFLKGRNDRNWTANFDWLITDANMAKVLSGNYDDHGSRANVPNGSPQTGNIFMDMLNERRGQQ